MTNYSWGDAARDAAAAANPQASDPVAAAKAIATAHAMAVQSINTAVDQFVAAMRSANNPGQKAEAGQGLRDANRRDQRQGASFWTFHVLNGWMRIYPNGNWEWGWHIPGYVQDDRSGHMARNRPHMGDGTPDYEALRRGMLQQMVNIMRQHGVPLPH